MNPVSTPSISVIVPVYKAEKYIHRCLDSIINQTFKNFELILVDDGSPDKSGEICDEYAAKDGRVKVIHKENGGVASARQCGIEAATGEYTIHADPDDWMELNMLECMFNAIEESDADLLITDFYQNIHNEATIVHQPVTSLNQEQLLKDFLTRLHGGLWNKLLRSKIYKDNNIGFVSGVNFWEDLLFWLQILQIRNLKISYLPKAFYHYDIFSNENSITRTNYKKFSKSLVYYISFVDKLDSNKFKKEKEYSIMKALALIFFTNADISADDYKYYLKKYRGGINGLQSYSEVSKIFLRMSYYSKRGTFLLLKIKEHIASLLKK